jgi:NADPH:quinone reductase-like Zn-dependent oxidoreductase
VFGDPLLTRREQPESLISRVTIYRKLGLSIAFVDLRVQPGQFVLVTTATGGAGLGAIQLARLLGATTLATNRMAEKTPALANAGANHEIVTGDETRSSHEENYQGQRRRPDF